MENIAGLVLAAGSGSRLGEPKAQVFYRGERLVDRAVRLLRDAGCSQIFVVLGAWVGEVSGATVIVNPEWQKGLSTSFSSGLRALEKFNLAEQSQNQIDSVLLTLVDLPGMTSEAFKAVAETTGEIVVAQYDGQRSHPMKFHRDHWAALIESSHGDHGARDFLYQRSDIEMVPIDAIADGRDLDFPEDFAHF